MKVYCQVLVATVIEVELPTDYSDEHIPLIRWMIHAELESIGEYEITDATYYDEKDNVLYEEMM